MRRLTLGILSVLLLVIATHPQASITKLKVRVILVDKDLNQKPVPHFALVLQPVESADAPNPVKTGLDGSAEAELPSGNYKLTTPEPVEFQSKRYQWEMEFTLSGPEFSLELSNDNAKVMPVATTASVPVNDNLVAQFKHLRDSVVAVHSEFGHGTGFLVDSSGLVVTNEHVVGKSEYLAVQFDARRKVAATLLASDSHKDVAVLRVNLSPYPEIVIAPLYQSASGKVPAAEGERVFTIGNPMEESKVLTTGVISQIDAKSIISDININPGSSGGPLFNSAGLVIGVTTYNKQEKRGPGLAGIVPIGEAMPLIDQARTKTVGVAPPPATLLPVDPPDPYPIDALRGLTIPEKVDRGPYGFLAGEFAVGLGTPAQAYRIRVARQHAIEKEREKRNKKRGDDETAENASDVDVKDYEAKAFKPELAVFVRPKIKVKFWASMGDPQHRMQAAYKTDFYRMRLLCGTQEVVPILPGKVPLGSMQNASVSLQDTSYAGLYYYPPDAVTPSCGHMTLEIYSDKNSSPAVKQLTQATIQAVWNDFEPYRKAHPNPPLQDPPARN